MKIVSLLIIILSGCAVNSGVVNTGQNELMLTRQAATGFSGNGTIKAEAFKEAEQYCSKYNKSLKTINVIEAQPPFVLGNFPKVELHFICIN